MSDGKDHLSPAKSSRESMLPTPSNADEPIGSESCMSRSVCSTCPNGGRSFASWCQHRCSSDSHARGVVVAVRHIESMIRMAEASAKMHLRGHVTNDDVDLAISVLLNSVIKSQKYAIARSMEKKFTRYLTQKKDTNQLLEFTLRKLFQHAAHNVYARRPRGAEQWGITLRRSPIISSGIDPHSGRLGGMTVRDR